MMNRQTFGSLAAFSCGAALMLFLGTSADAEAPAQCKAARDFMEHQVEAGLDPLTYTPQEIQWMWTNRSSDDCTPIPEMLRQRMMGTAIPSTLTHITCHAVFDWMLERLEAGESFTDEQMEWGRSYADGVPNGETCAAPPDELKLRAFGHRIQSADMKQFLATAMDEAGDGDAALEIALAYFNGTIVGKDDEKGYSYLLAASELGSPGADWELSGLYLSGLVEGMGNAEGVKYLEQAANGGVNIAMLKLANAYDEGKIVRQDPAKSFFWYNQAAEHGDLFALRMVASKLFEGEGTKKDRAEAISLARTGSRAGDPLAMLQLVSFMLQVDNAKQLIDREGEIQYWFGQAVASGNPTAIQSKAQMGAQIDKLFEKAKYSPPPVRSCPRVLKCDVYYYNNGRQSQKICAEYPSWRACSAG